MVDMNKISGQITYQTKRLIGGKTTMYAIADVLRNSNTRKSWKMEGGGNRGQARSVLVAQSLIVFESGQDFPIGPSKKRCKYIHKSGSHDVRVWQRSCHCKSSGYISRSAISRDSPTRWRHGYYGWCRNKCGWHSTLNLIAYYLNECGENVLAFFFLQFIHILIFNAWKQFYWQQRQFFSTSIGGLFSIHHKDKLHRIMGFTAGVLLGVVFFDILPEIISLIKENNFVPTGVTIALVYGISDFSYSRKNNFNSPFSRSEYADHKHPQVGVLSALALAGHSFMDGVGIGLGFQVNPTVGLLVAIAVIAHDFTDGMNTVTLVLNNRNSIERARWFLLLDASLQF